MSSYNKSEGTKQKIIDASIKLLEEKGYSNITVREICKEAKVSLNALNYHFKSKDNLFLIITNLLPSRLYNHLEERYIEIKENDPLAFHVSFTFSLIDILLHDGRINDVFRELYSQEFVYRNIVYSIQHWFIENHNLFSRPLSQQMISIYSHTYTGTLTSLIKRGTYEYTKNDIKKTKIIFSDIFFMLLDIDDQKEKIVNTAMYISNHLRTHLYGLDDAIFIDLQEP